jgi:hypothetical protein
VARIQVLELPTEVDGDNVRTPFALIIDQVDSETIDAMTGDTIRQTIDADQVTLANFAADVKAEALIVYPGTLDLA